MFPETLVTLICTFEKSCCCPPSRNRRNPQQHPTNQGSPHPNPSLALPHNKRRDSITRPGSRHIIGEPTAAGLRITEVPYHENLPVANLFLPDNRRAPALSALRR